MILDALLALYAFPAVLGFLQLRIVLHDQDHTDTACLAGLLSLLLWCALNKRKEPKLVKKIRRFLLWSFLPFLLMASYLPAIT